MKSYKSLKKLRQEEAIYMSDELNVDMLTFCFQKKVQTLY
jgi:hypothetical protein